MTLRDVAREAGVSVITASRALGNPGVVSATTIAKVQAAAASLDYVPNLVAGGLKSRRSMMVASLVPAISVAQFLPTVQALTESLDAAGYQLVLGQAGYDHAREETLLNMMMARRTDGIVITGLIQSAAMRDKLRQLNVPVVETWDLTDRPVDMLAGFSHLKAGGAVAGLFLAKGYKRVGLASGDDRRAAIRREGFLATWGRRIPTSIVPAPSTVERGRQALRELLFEDPKLRAVFCSSDQLAQGVLAEAVARGLSVPHELAVCGFGGADFAASIEPSLTTVHIDGAAIGRTAASMILARCRGANPQQRIVDVGFQIIERASTGG